MTRTEPSKVLYHQNTTDRFPSKTNRESGRWAEQWQLKTKEVVENRETITVSIYRTYRKYKLSQLLFVSIVIYIYYIHFLLYFTFTVRR